MPVTILQAARERSANRRRRIQLAFTRTHAGVERAALRQLAPFYRDLTASVMARVRSARVVGFGVDDIFRASEFRVAFNKAMAPAWNLGLFTGIKFEEEAVGAARRQSLIAQVRQQIESPPSIHVDMTPDMLRSLREYLRTREAGVWGDVSTTMHDRLRRSIQRGLKDGETFDQMQDRIQGTMRQLSNYQSRRIARTETTGAMNRGQQVERDELEIAHKEWVSTLDSANRGANPNSAFDHLTCDGQIVLNEEAFLISGQKLLHPGDTSLGASAGNVIQCRCCATGAWVDMPKTTSRRETGFSARFRDSEATVEIHPMTRPSDISRASRKIFGANLKKQMYASLVGAPDNSDVVLSLEEGDIWIHVVGHADGLEAGRSLMVKEGKRIIYNDFFSIQTTGEGLGLKMFAAEVQNARRFKFREIHTYAARGSQMNGYYTWPRMGYNAPLPDAWRERFLSGPNIPKHMKSARTVADLMITPAGREYWKAHGISLNMVFDLDPKSTSMATLDAYLRERGVRGEQSAAAQRLQSLKAMRRGPRREPDQPYVDANGQTRYEEIVLTADDDEALDRVWDARQSKP